jgi:hypothetical protein
MSGGSHKTSVLVLRTVLKNLVRFSNYKKTNISSSGNLSGFQIFEKIKCSQISVEPVLINF